MQHTSRTAFSATVHCLAGCAVGEILGLVIGTALLLSDAATVSLAVVLAFCFGYAFTMLPLLRHGLGLKAALSVALAADSLSILVMEIVDNAIMLLIPGAMDAELTSGLFWGSLALALFVAFWAAFPVNLYLLRRDKGHALHHHGKE
jgi:hypothetical protein